MRVATNFRENFAQKKCVRKLFVSLIAGQFPVKVPTNS